MNKKEQNGLIAWLVFIFVMSGLGLYIGIRNLNADVELVTYDITTSTIIVNWYKTEAELQAAMGDDTLAGLADCDWRPDFNVSFCELWLVEPEHSDDYYNYDTIGHEVYHALKGDFH
jgi:hypothetical protein